MKFPGLKLNKPVNTSKCVVTARFWTLTRRGWRIAIHRAYDWAPRGIFIFRENRVYSSTYEDVVAVGYEEGGFGNYVKTKVCEYPIYLYYAHLKNVFVQKGQMLIPSQYIGIMGNTGFTYSSHGGDGTHLHQEGREIRDRDKLVPLDLAFYYKDVDLDALYPEIEVCG